MRIRKHASKILGSASCQAWLSSPAPCVDDPAPPHFELCELNQSPWDVLPTPQLPDFHLSDRPHLKVKQDDEEEEEDNDDDDENNDNDRIILSVISRKKKKKKNVNKKNKKELKRMESNGMCNKSDGKGWRCKKPVQPPHTLCHYHLAQLRSYNAAYRAPSTAGAVANQRRKPGSGGGLTDNGGDFYYYYSGFGPWRSGKRRSRETVVDDDEDDNEEEEEDGDVNGVDEIDSVEEDGSDDGDEEDELEEKKRKMISGVVCRKRGRRRIKARSLKSLL